MFERAGCEMAFISRAVLVRSSPFDLLTLASSHFAVLLVPPVDRWGDIACTRGSASLLMGRLREHENFRFGWAADPVCK
jgi:hypothetical protein